MTTGLNTLRRTSKRASPALGRGGKRGKTSGRGMKGQKSRAGNRRRPEMRDTIKKIPKLRGHGKNRSRTVNSSRVASMAVGISSLSVFVDKEEVTRKTLIEKGIISARGGRVPIVKIVANGSIASGVAVKGIPVSKAAKDAIEKAGGSVK